jgi:hypothetical protein
VESEHPLEWLYLYGVVRRSAIDLSRVAGVEGGCDVSLVCEGELACAASPVSHADYGREAVDAPAEQLNWLAPRAIRHQEVVHCLRETGAVVPLRFGTLCPTAEEVRQMLRERHRPLLQLLAFLQEREEWGVKVFANPDLAGQATEQLGGATDELPPASPGKAYFLNKKKRKLAHERTILRIAELDREIWERLLPCAVEARKHRCQDASSGASQLAVLNAALLLDRDQQAALAQVAGRLEAEYGRYGVTVELSGPWAAYSFCGDLGRVPAAADAWREPERCAD